MIDHLCDQVEPLAVVRKNGALVYQNPVFEQTVGQNISSEVLNILLSSMLTKSEHTRQSGVMSRLGRRLYEVKVTVLNDSAMNDSRLHLLRWTRVTSHDEKMFRQLKCAGLTLRELEIVTLIQQNISPHDISRQLHISYHTVRNHTKHIYSKLGVNKRSEMLSWGE